MPFLVRPRYCPACGGPNPDAGASSCRFCDGALVPVGTPDPAASVRCGRCGTSMAGGAGYCSTCGLALAEPERHPVNGPCPSCGRALEGWSLSASGPYRGGHPVAACHGCGGVWLPHATQRAMIESAAAEAERQGEAATNQVVRQQLPVGILAAAVVYRSCPSCGKTMARKNFGGCSGVIVDECPCGTFFDTGELENVLAFVRSGGMQLARRRRDDDERRRREAAQQTAESQGSWAEREGAWDSYDPTFSLTRWLTDWLVGR